MAMCIVANEGKAQCITEGTVLESPCGDKLILDLDSFNFLIPTDNSLEFVEVGSNVLFAAELEEEVVCMSSVYFEANITCLEVASAPPVNCDADFLYSESFNSDGKPVVLFEPMAVSQDMEYTWDFGDNTNSGEVTPEHVYEEQGFYEVCLTINSANCYNEVHCKTIDLNQCKAAFSHETLEDGLVEFYNFSEGNFTQWEWKMGDGAIFTNEELHQHGYNGIDIYTVCLTVWNDNGCSSEYCDYVFTGTGDVCDFSDCVLPGDTDVDEAANVYDLLPIGVAFGSEGPPRTLNDVAFPSNAWEPQYSPDWGLETISGIDYKHIDCNGDGTVDDGDMQAIEDNYAAPSSVFQVTANGEPYFWLEFDWDTIVINDNTPAFITLEADLMAGFPDRPFDDLRGFALQMDYPEDYVLEGGGVEVDYNDNSFFGSSNDILWMGKDRTQGGVMDVGFTRKSAFGNGFGKVADVSFVIIGDVIPRSEYAVPFDVNINGVVAVNQEGAQLTLDQPIEPATLIILNQTTTNTSVEVLNQEVSVFPNPAGDNLWLSFGELRGEKIEVFNSLGQSIDEQVVDSTPFQMDVSEYAEGVYLLHVHTDEGVAKKRVVVE